MIRPEGEMGALVSLISTYTDDKVDRSGLWTHRTKDGRLLRVDITSHPIDLGRGRRGRMVLGVDMTDHLAAVEDLRRSESLLRMASKMGRMGAWQIELPSLANQWSDEVRAIHEVGPEFNPDKADLISYYAPEEHGRLTEIFGACMTVGSPFDEELRFITAKGRRRWVRVIGEAVRDEEGRIIRVQGAMQDIDEEHRLREEASALAERLKRTLESITDAFIMLDRDWRFTFINAAAERQMEKKPEDVVGRVLWDLYPALEGTVFGKGYRRAMEEQVPITLEDYYAPRDRWLELRFYPSEDGLAVYMRNVTERHRSREALVHSEERFSLLAKATNDAMWDWAPDGGTLWWNDGLTSLFGYRPDEVATVDKWLERIHPADRKRTSDSLYAALATGVKVWSVDYHFQRKDGNYASVLDRGYIIRDESGKPTRMIGGMTDLTERLEAQEALRESEERHRQTAGLLTNVLDSSLDVICSFDPEGNFLQVSAACESVWGFTPEELLGKSYIGLIMLEDQVATAEVMASVITGREVRNFENRVMRKDGEVVWMQWSGRWSPGDRIVFCVARDITEKRQLERQFMRAQRVESIGTLAGGIAHDLNNMLLPIMMSVDLLKAGMKDPANRDLLEVIGMSARRGAEMVAQVLSFARGMDGRRTLVQSEALIREVIKIVTETFPRIIRYDWDIDPGLWTLDADPTQLHQVLVNLCVNARDAMPEGGQLTLHAGNAVVDETYAAQNIGATPGLYVRIRIEDTGHGMSPEVLDQIFDPFFTTKEPGKGTGLGLSTALTIVRGHGGFMRVSSRPNIGTQFLIYLPARPDEVVAESSDSDEVAGGAGELILIVDDEAAIRAVARQTLESHGYRTLVAADGAEALAIFKETPGIAAVVTDMSMPVMNGLALIRSLRELDSEVRIIATSGMMEEGAVRHAGVAHFIQKPYTVETLLKAVAGRG
jgi:PAS domain S-box-containing protein